MQIVIPMSGYGERFRTAGYTVPKPLIEIDGKPIIEYVVGMFPGEDDFLFICNQEHLDTQIYQMERILKGIAPQGVVVGIAPHDRGPVHAVLEAWQYLRSNQPLIINYCDFACDWDYENFKKYIEENKCDGCIPCYRGFHPHSIWSKNYAYVREENLIGCDIQEKQPFTENHQSEFASSGTYFFKSAEMFRQYAEQSIEAGLSVDGEYYVSMVYKPMFNEGCRIFVYELNHFMQWGTPSDLENYVYWSGAFRRLNQKKETIEKSGILLMPMAGFGSRFEKAGYKTPKPLIEVSGIPMAERALRSLSNTDEQIFVLREDTQCKKKLVNSLSNSSLNPKFVTIDSPTDGQASTCMEGLKSVHGETCVTISACDHGVLYDGNCLEKLLRDTSVDVIVWGVVGYPGAIFSPEMYGWIDWNTQDGKVSRVSVKTPLKNLKTDPIVVGTFTFKRISDFTMAVSRMKERRAHVNGEYYVDTVVNDALALGLNCALFLVDYYLCWGTPSDLNTYHYWEECFENWEQHPYSAVGRT